MIRSFLFVPADSEKKLSKCVASEADAIILDLEDSVASRNKSSARKLVAEFLSDHQDQNHRFWVRVNALESTEFPFDQRLLRDQLPQGIVLPKCHAMASVQKLAQSLAGLERADKTRILAIVTETAAGVLNMGSYQIGHPQLYGMTWGAEDLATDLGAFSNKDETGELSHPYRLARSLCLLGAASAGVYGVEGVYTDFRDDTGLMADTQRAKRDGFFGRMAIHPRQVPIINEAFLPTDQEIQHAQQVVSAFGEQDSVGVVSMDGKMLDIPHLKAAEKLLALAAHFGLNTTSA